MKESKFIELLNLYVDHQISPAESTLLEAEVRSDPARRRVYREYCEMQKGCAALAEVFRAEAPATETKIAGFKPRRSVGAMTYLSGLVAVAACAAVVLVGRSRLNESTLLATPVPPPEIAATTEAAPAMALDQTLAPRPALQPAFGQRVFTLREPGAEPAEVATTDQAAFGDWMNGVQLSSLPGTTADDLHFDARATLQPDTRTYRAGRPIQGKVEWTAFTFQK